MTSKQVKKYLAVQQGGMSNSEAFVRKWELLFQSLDIAARELLSRQRMKANQPLSQAQTTLLELRRSIDHQAAPELTDQLLPIYDFCLRRLTEANSKNDGHLVEEVTRTLQPIKEAFFEIIARPAPGKPTP